MKKVYLGMSGGVDSSVSALLLKDQGYDVTGVYMKNWSEDLPGMKCPWAEDLADAKRVAVQLDLDFEVWDFEKDYKAKVVDYMLTEFKKGRTPNPDVMCNELIKFKLFYDWAMERSADFIATGHYAQVGRKQNACTGGILAAERVQSCDEDERAIPITTSYNNAPRGDEFPPLQVDLLKAVDANKDQTYFLYRMSDAATAKTLFPIGAMDKPAVKQLAKDRGLDVATKKESMGICFVGEVGMKDFLARYIAAQPGEIREQETDQVLGYHDGAIFYTIGQRHGLYLGGGLPYYVVGKDLEKNLVFVSRNLNHENLWTTELNLENLHLRSGRTLEDLINLPSPAARALSGDAPAPVTVSPSTSALALDPRRLQVRLRHRAPLIDCQIKTEKSKDGQTFPKEAKRASKLNAMSDGPVKTGAGEGLLSGMTAQLIFSQPIKRPAPGQSAVLYSGDICLGGGIVAE